MIINSPKIHIWLPGLFDYKGGIQVYSSFLVRALAKILPNDNQFSIFLKNDRPKINNLKLYNQAQFYFFGQWSFYPFHTLIFTIHILIAALLNRPYIIICGHVNFSPIAAKISSLLNIPYWVIVHGIDVWELNDSSRINALKLSEKIISVSQYTRNRLIQEQQISPDKIYLLPNTFDLKKFNINQKPKYLLERYKLSINQPIVLTVARLTKEEGYKGYDRVIRALSQIIIAIPNIHYLICGQGNDRPRIEQLIRDLSLEKYITVTGFISEQELAAHYNLCDVFALPSKREGFGIVYLEAMACGKPCLGGNQDGAVDALRNGELGALVNPDNIDEIAQTLIQILQKTYPNPIMYQPKILRQKVIEIYGFQHFQETLNSYLNEFFK